MESRIASAFKEQENMVGMSVFLAASIFFLNPVPLIVGALLEVAYILFVPDSNWYSNRLETKQRKLIEERRSDLSYQFRCLATRENAAKYQELTSVRAQLDDDYVSRPDWRDVINRLDTLLDKYVEFGLQDIRLREYLASLSKQADENIHNIAKPRTKGEAKLRDRLSEIEFNADNFTDKNVRWVEEQMASIRFYFQNQEHTIQQLISEEDARITAGTGNINNRDILQKRLEIQAMSLSQAEKIGQGLVNLNQQMVLMEETIRLINGQIKSKQPGQVLLDIENLVDQSETVSNFLHEIAPFETSEETRLMLSR